MRSALQRQQLANGRCISRAISCSRLLLLNKAPRELQQVQPVTVMVNTTSRLLLEIKSLINFLKSA